MRRGFGLAVAAVALIGATASAQDASTAVKDGGVKVKDWAGKIDAREAGQGMTINDAKFAPMGKGMHITTGPATTRMRIRSPESFSSRS